MFVVRKNCFINVLVMYFMVKCCTWQLTHIQCAILCEKSWSDMVEVRTATNPRTVCRSKTV